LRILRISVRVVQYRRQTYASAPKDQPKGAALEEGEGESQIQVEGGRALGDGHRPD